MGELIYIEFKKYVHTLPFNSPRVKALNRIGPHHLDILSIVFGSLLGDGSLSRDGEGTRLVLYQSGGHAQYLLYIHVILAELGYCPSTVPVISARLKYGVKDSSNEHRHVIRFRTFSFSSFNWIFDAFYPEARLATGIGAEWRKSYNNGTKRVPLCIADYLTPRALAIWIMDDGTLYKNKGLRLCTNGFMLEDVLLLQKVLLNSFSLKTSLHQTGVPNQYGIYIWKSSMNKLRDITGTFIHPSMKYKIGP